MHEPGNNEPTFIQVSRTQAFLHTLNDSDTGGAALFDRIGLPDARVAVLVAPFIEETMNRRCQDDL